MPTIEQAAADNLISVAMQQEKEVTAILLLNSAKRIDPTVEISVYHEIWLEQWLDAANRERSKQIVRGVYISKLGTQDGRRNIPHETIRPSLLI